MTRKQWDALLARLKKKAELGDAEAQWELGSWLEDGLIDRRGSVVVPADPRTAVRWFRRSASLGCVEAQNTLGVCLSEGRGAIRNEQEALIWLRRAAKQGDRCAANNVACVYRDKGNYRNALLWYRRAVAEGDGDALVEVGISYYAGLGTKRDRAYAVACFRKAIRGKAEYISQAGREQAMYHLGIAYRDGEGVRKSLAKARKWLSTANKDDDFPAARDALRSIARK